MTTPTPGPWVLQGGYIVGPSGPIAKLVARRRLTAEALANGLLLAGAWGLLRVVRLALEQTHHADSCVWWHSPAAQAWKTSEPVPVDGTCTCWRHEAHGMVARVEG